MDLTEFLRSLRVINDLFSSIFITVLGRKTAPPPKKKLTSQEKVVDYDEEN
jgi:hypothetical protein